MFLHYWSGRPRAALFGVYAAFAVVLQGLLVDMLGPSPSGDDGGSRVDYSNPAASWGFISTGLFPLSQPTAARLSRHAVVLPPASPSSSPPFHSPQAGCRW